MAVAPVPARSAAVVGEEEEEKKRVRVTGTCTVLCDERVCSFFVFFFHAGGTMRSVWGDVGEEESVRCSSPQFAETHFQLCNN